MPGHFNPAGTPKSFTDRRDIALLLLRFPELKTEFGLVRERLVAGNADDAVLSVWRDLAAQEIREEDEDEGY